MQRGQSAADIHCNLLAMYGGNVMPARMVCEWVHHFCSSNRMDIYNEVRGGKPHYMTNEDTRMVIFHTLESDC